MKTILLTSVIGLIVTTGCANKTETGALVGAGVGVVGGGLIGGGTGAIIGGAVGAAGGALVGYALDEHDRNKLEKEHPKTLKKIDRGEPLSTDDIKKMSKSGLSDRVINNQIDATGSQFQLTTDEIISLKNAGVSQNVIDHMIETGKR